MILIDIEMPNSCQDCPMHTRLVYSMHPATHRCNADKMVFIDDAEAHQKRAHDCPIISEAYIMGECEK